MIIKRFTAGTDFGKSLRQRRWAAGVMALAGLGGLLLALGVLPGADLPSHALSFYQGAASGILACGAVLLLRTQYLIGHPDRWKAARIRETDEREQRITVGAAQFAGAATIALAAAAAFVAVALDCRLALALVALILAYGALFQAARWWLAKKI